jgi:hypothetical protein
MMRKVTQAIYQAFVHKETKTQDNTFTDGQVVLLHGNCIVRRTDGEVFISLGWYGYSKTTAERLKPFGAVTKRKGAVYLNGKPWDGNWTKVEQ